MHQKNDAASGEPPAMTVRSHNDTHVASFSQWPPPVPDLGEVALHLQHARRRNGLQDLRHLRRSFSWVFSWCEGVEMIRIPTHSDHRVPGRAKGELAHDDSRQLWPACCAVQPIRFLSKDGRVQYATRESRRVCRSMRTLSTSRSAMRTEKAS